MANEITIKATSEADTTGIADVNKSLAETKVAATIAGAELDRLGDNFTESDRMAAVASRGITNVKDSLLKLDAAAIVSRTEINRLSAALADTDDAAQRLDIRKAISKIQADLNSTLGAQKALLTIDVDIDKNKFARRLEAVGQDVAGLASNHVGATIGAAIGAAAAPVLLATLGSALSAGAGAGAIGAGIALAVKADPKLKAAGKEAGTQFMNAIGEGAKSAFSGPLMESIEILSDAGDDIADSWTKAFAALGPSIVPLTRDLAGAITRISDSLAGMAANSGPALDGLGDSIGLLADGVGDFLDTVSDGSPEAAANLTLVAGALADLIRFQGNFLNVINDLSDNAWLTGPLIPLLRDHYVDAANATGTFAKHQTDLGQAMEGVTIQAEFQRNGLTNLGKDMLALTDPVFGLLNAEDKLAAAQKKATEAAREHGEGSKEADAALRDLAEAAIEVEIRAGELAETGNGQLTPALRATLQAAGVTEEQLEDLERQFIGARQQGQNFAKTYEAKVKANTETAEARIKHVRELLKQVRSKQITVDVLVNESRLNKVQNTLDRFGGAYAHGGITGAANGATSSGMTLVGEQGPELVGLPSGSRVWSAGDSARMMDNMGGGSGDFSGTIKLVPAAGLGAELINAVLSVLRVEVDRNGNGSVSNLLNRPGVTT